MLNYAVSNGIINMKDIQDKLLMKERNDLLAKHPYKIWKGNDQYWHTYLPDISKRNQRKPVKRKQEEDIKTVVIDFWREKSSNPTILEVFEEWNDRRLELKKISNATHLRNKNVYNRHYKDFGEYRIKPTSPEEFEEFLEEQIPIHNLTSKAFSNLKSITRGFLKRAKKRKLIDYNVEEIFQNLDTSESDFIKIIKEDYEEVFNEEEFPYIIDYLKNNMDMMNIGILLMFVTGVRIGEIVTLKHQDFTDKSFAIRRTETRYVDSESQKYVCAVKEFPKSQAGVRTVVLPNQYMWLIKEIKKLNPFGEYIFVKNGNRISTQSMRMRLKRICKKLKIYHKSPHKIRKTYATILLDNNVDQRLITGQLGHTEVLCTENHYHRNRRNIDRKVEIISKVPDFMTK